MFSDDPNFEEMSKISDLLFHKLKSKYNLKANSYSEMIDEIRGLDSMDDDLKSMLVEFFQYIIVTAYKDPSASEFDKNDIKKKLKIILHTLDKDE